MKTVWKLFIPGYALPANRFAQWLTPQLLARLPREIDYSTIVKSVNGTEWNDLFDKARCEIQSSWNHFTPDAKSGLLETVADLKLWAYFKRSCLTLTTKDQIYLKARWDISDILYNEQKRDTIQALTSLGLNFYEKYIHAGEDNVFHVKDIIAGLRDLVIQRGHLDMAMLVALDIPRADLQLNRVAERLTSEYFTFLDLLRHALKVSTVYKLPDGQVILGEEDVAKLSVYESMLLKQEVEKRLKPFNEDIRAFIDSLSSAVPERTAVDNVGRMLAAIPQRERKFVPVSEPSNLVDFLIVPPLEEERDAILHLLPGAKLLPPDGQDNRVYYDAQLEARLSDETDCVYRVIVVPLVGMGIGQASATTSDAIRRWSPRYIVVVGIAGGVKSSHVALGDILIANQIADYSIQKKRQPKRDEIRWVVHQADTGLLERATNFRGNKWQDLISCPRPEPGEPQRHIGPIASGDHVVASNRILASYKAPWPKLVGVEMEAGGIARVAFQAVPQSGFFMVRGVSDFADPDKDSTTVVSWRAYACQVAAAYTIAFLRSGPALPVYT